MPSLMASLGVNASSFRSTLASSISEARTAGEKIIAALNPSRSTVVNPRETKGAAEKYSEFWSSTLLERDIQAAKRSNEARRLLRQRAASREQADAVIAQNQLDDAVEAASRRNLARRIRRERAQARAARATGGEVGGIGAIGSALGGQIGAQLMGYASAGYVAHLSKQVIDFGGAVSDMSRRLGISTDSVQAWDYALRLNGATIDNASAFFRQLARTRQDALQGNEQAIASFKKFGIAVDDLKTLRLDDIGLRIAAAFKGADPQSLVADLQNIGGRGADALVAAFAAGFADLVNEARNAGVIIDEQIIKKLDEAGDRMTQIGMRLRVGLAPALAWMAEMLDKAWQGWEGLVNVMTGFATGGFKGAKEQLAAYKAELKAQAEARAKGGNPIDSPPGPETDRNEEARVNKILALQKQLSEMQKENALQALDKEGQIQELYRRRAEILKRMKSTGVMSEEGSLENQIELEKLDERIRGLNKSKPTQMSVNSLQRIGAYISDPTKNAQLDVAKKSERNLDRIDKKMDKLVKSSGVATTTF
jgi:hypothetical protein